MKAEELFFAIGEIDDTMIDDALNVKRKLCTNTFVKWGAVAACFIVAAVLSVRTFEKGKDIQKESVVNVTESGADEKIKNEEIQCEIAENIQQDADDSEDAAIMTENGTAQTVVEEVIENAVSSEEQSFDTDESIVSEEKTAEDELPVLTDAPLRGGGGGSASGGGSATGEYSLSYLAELENRIAEAMEKGELPFVISYSLVGTENRIEVVVNTSDETQLVKVRRLDEKGGYIKFVYIEE